MEAIDYFLVALITILTAFFGALGSELAKDVYKSFKENRKKLEEKLKKNDAIFGSEIAGKENEHENETS